MTDIEDRLDRLELHLEDHRRRLADHEAALNDGEDEDEDERNDGPSLARPGLTAGGLLAALGLTAGTGTAAAAADPQGQVGTADRPLEALYTDTLAGPVTDSQVVESLVDGGLTVRDGTLSPEGEDEWDT